MGKLVAPAKVGNTIFNIGVDESLVILSAIRNYSNSKTVKKINTPIDKALPTEVICLSCLTTQSTRGVINRGNSCFSCENTIDPYNLSDIEV
jgi:hypothetical protein